MSSVQDLKKQLSQTSSVAQKKYLNYKLRSIHEEKYDKVMESVMRDIKVLFDRYNFVIEKEQYTYPIALYKVNGIKLTLTITSKSILCKIGTFDFLYTNAEHLADTIHKSSLVPKFIMEEY